MRRSHLSPVLLVLAATCAGHALARPPVPSPADELLAPAAAGCPSPGVTYSFGGTVWAADSARWEAVFDSVWTFDTGVGSSFQHTDPNKNPALHASMEGWTGVDLTLPPASQRFRRLSASAFPGTACVGSPAGLGGQYAFWAGLFASEADSLCWAGGRGYGNSWFTCISREFQYDDAGCLRLGFSFFTEMEDYDTVLVVVDTTGSGVFGAPIQTYSGTVDGTAGIALDLQEGIDLRSDAGPIRVSFCLRSDLTGSDEDGLFDTSCGAFAVDDIVVATTPCGGSLNETSDFEGGTDGWEAVTPVVGAGDVTHLAAVADLPPRPDSLSCDLGDSVLVFFDPDAPPQQPHSLLQDNLAVSPWIDLGRAGLVGQPYKYLEIGGYLDIPYPTIFFRIWYQWYPYVCPETGEVRASDWAYPDVFHSGLPGGDVPTPQCGPLVLCEDLSSAIPLNAEQVRVGIEVVDPCSIFGMGTTFCVTQNNTTPWFDNIRFVVGASASVVPPEPPTTPVLTAVANPFRGPLAIRYAAPEGVIPDLRIYDIRGALVRDLPLTMSKGTVTWDGARENGSQAPAGVYFLQLVAGRERRSIRVVRLQ